MFSKSRSTKLIFIIALAFMIGCGGVTVNEEKAMEVFIKIGARNMAKYILKNNPSHIDKVEFYCKAMANEEITQAVLDTAMAVLTEYVGTYPEIKSDFDDLKELVVFDMKDPNFNIDYVYSAINGFLEGAELARLTLN